MCYGVFVALGLQWHELCQNSLRLTLLEGKLRLSLPGVVTLRILRTYMLTCVVCVCVCVVDHGNSYDGLWTALVYH